VLGAEEYLSKVIINGEEKDVIITVLDPKNILYQADVEDMIPLLGRNFLDHFDVLFQGKKKTITFSR
jgi:hypothetical protein